jgi:Bacterial Ig-like domain (group 3)
MRLRDWSLRIIRAITLARHMAGAVVLLLLFSSTVQATQPVLQRGYNEGVTGATLAETTLNTTNVAPGTFGLVFILPVDDAVFAQPLYVPNVVIPSQGTHNVVYVATMSDTLYAFDADAGGAPLWSVNFASLVGATPVPIAEFEFSDSKNIVGNLGILSTPVIDPSTHVMYLVACTLENGTMAYRLHAVDITTGTEPYGPGVLISGSYGTPPSTISFDGRYQTQRVSLVVSGNQVVFAFGAVELEYAGGYVGWVMSYDKQTLKQSGIFPTVPTAAGQGGGVWQSGRPPVVDSAGHVYVFVGNAFGCCGYDGVANFSESVLKLDPANGLKLLSWFTPGDWNALDASDLDLSSSGPLLIPGTNHPSLLAGGGKNCELYVLSTAQLGKFNANDSQVVQKEKICSNTFRGGPVYWQRSAANGGPLLYNWGSSDYAKSYAFSGTQFAATPSSQGTATQIWPGGILTLSANGEQHGSGVLWATVAISGDANNDPPVPGELRAFNAENLSQELWNSEMNASDGFGNFAKFVPPLVANGKVYTATWSNQVAVYGLLKQATATGISSSANPSTYGQPVTFTATVTSSSGTPTGTVRFMMSGTLMGTATLTGGVATFAKTFQGVATKSITAVYLGNAAFTGSSSSVLSQAVGQATTTVGLTPSQNPATVGQPVIFTATVASSSGTPTGKVVFSINGTSMATVALAGGVATYSKTFQGSATKSITARYLGSADFAGSTSQVLSEAVQPATP